MAFFSHLNVHSKYSLMESTISINELANAAVKNDMKTTALTDKHVLSGAVEFYRQATEKNIKPIISCEISITNNGVLSRMIILIKDIKGYENLCQIVSKSNMEKRGLLPTVKISDLEKMNQGLIGLNCCETGEISLLLKAGKTAGALTSAAYYRELFKGDFFLEIQRYPKTRSSLTSSSLSEVLINFALKNSFPVVATNNVHYLNKEDYSIYKYLSRIKEMGKNGGTAVRPIGNNEHYFKSAPEMLEMEEEILGFCASSSPLRYFKNELEEYRNVRSRYFPDLAAGKRSIFNAGIIIARKIKKTRDGKDMLLCIMEDEDGMYEIIFFPHAYKKNLKIIINHSAIMVRGQNLLKRR